MPEPLSLPSSQATRGSRLPLVVWLWAAVCVVPYLLEASVSWHFFPLGSTLLLGRGPGAGLQVYAGHPQLQFGPLTLLAAIPLSGLPYRLGEAVAVVVLAAVGPVLLLSLRRLMVAPSRLRDRRVLLAALPFIPVWDEVAVHFGHLDDVLALALTTAALHALARRRPVVVALLLAAAVDAKPWAAAFVALLLVFRGRTLLKAAAAWVAGVSVAWLPFLLGARGTAARLRHFTIPVSPTSALHVLGVHASRTPAWDRPAQLLLGVVLGAVLVRRGRWPAVLLAAIAARVLLDPGTYPYYTSGVVLATVVLDLLMSSLAVPVVTLLATASLYLVLFRPLRYLMTSTGLADLRAAFAVAAVVLAVLLPGTGRDAVTAAGSEPESDDTRGELAPAAA